MLCCGCKWGELAGVRLDELQNSTNTQKKNPGQPAFVFVNMLQFGFSSNARTTRCSFQISVEVSLGKFLTWQKKKKRPKNMNEFATEIIFLTYNLLVMISEMLYWWTELISEGYGICVQPVIFWWPVRCSNYWAKCTKLMSEGYICVQPVTFWRPVRSFNHWATWTTRWWVKVYI